MLQYSVNSCDKSYWNGLFDGINWKMVRIYYKK